MRSRLWLVAPALIVIAGLAIWLPQALSNERAVYVNGVRGYVLQGYQGTGYVINDFVPRSAYARSDGPPLRIQTAGDATWVRASLGRGTETLTRGGTPSDIDRLLPTDYWDWMVVEVYYGPSRYEEYAALLRRPRR